MTYLCIVFVPPLYFLTRKLWGGLVVSAILWGMALLCLISIVGIVVAPFFWLLAIGHAAFAYRKEAMREQAELLATKMAEKLEKR